MISFPRAALAQELVVALQGKAGGAHTCRDAATAARHGLAGGAAWCVASCAAVAREHNQVAAAALQAGFDVQLLVELHVPRA